MERPAVNIDTAALIVVDMQNGFLNEANWPVVGVVEHLVEHWSAAGGAVIFTRYHNYPDSPFVRLIKWSKLQASPEVDIVAELAAHADQAHAMLDKTAYTVFTAEGTALIKEGGWTNLLFCGVATESCVLKSAVDAFELGYTPWLITDASASDASAEAHDAGLLVASRFIGRGQLITAAEVLAGIPERGPAAFVSGRLIQ
jgi:nicotinamidase-related amidase